ncbi:unnamed protein product [Leuciscus chuanchicus]
MPGCDSDCDLHGDECSDLEDDNDDDLRGLAEWAAEFNIPQTALSALPKILRRKGLDIPMDGRTLMTTDRSCNVANMAGGSYYHFGIENALIAELTSLGHLANVTDTLALRINIDGLPLFRSSSMSLWPILVYSGASKPANVQEYLQEFIVDMKAISHSGIVYNGVHFRVPLPNAFICDAPARAFLKCSKGRTGYYGCERCFQKGQYINGKARLTAPTVSLPLNDLGIGLVTSFVLDYMHLVCLGTMRKLIFLWLKGPLKCRQSMKFFVVMSAYMVSIRQYLPSNFARKPQSLFELTTWKATELRLFLLYTCPVVLLNNIPSRTNRSFLLLSVSMRIFLSPALCSPDNCDYAEEILKLFVTDFAAIYGTEFVSYNMHSLIHLALDARKFSPLDSVSAFPFETFLGKLKKLQPQNPVQQLVRRIHGKQKVARQKTTSVFSPLKQLHFSGPMINSIATWEKYRRYNDGQTLISSSRFLLCGNILSHSGTVKVLCNFFETAKSFFNYPMDSSCIGILFVFNLSENLQLLPVEELKTKMVLLPLKTGYLALPLLHYLIYKWWRIGSYTDQWSIGPEEDECCWPPARMNMAKNMAVIEQQDPHTDWATYKWTVKRKVATYEIAHTKLVEYEQNTDVPTESDSTENTGRGKRKREGFPLKTVRDVEIMEEKLANPNFMSELCAHTHASGSSFLHKKVDEVTRRMVTFLLDHGLSKQCNFEGRKREERVQGLKTI